MPSRKPYTDRGISRVPCTRCSAPSKYQWQVCADAGVWHGVCAACDIGLNELALRFMRLPGAEDKLAEYRKRVIAAGGRQIAVHLSADAVAALDALKGGYPSQSDAISAALLAFDARRPSVYTPLEFSALVQGMSAQAYCPLAASAKEGVTK